MRLQGTPKTVALRLVVRQEIMNVVQIAAVSILTALLSSCGQSDTHRSPVLQNMSEAEITAVVSNFCTSKCSQFGIGYNGIGNLIVSGTAHSSDLDFQMEIEALLEGYNRKISYYPVDYFDGHSFYLGLVPRQ